MSKVAFFSGILGGLLISSIIIFGVIFLYDFKTFNINIINPNKVDSIAVNLDKVSLIKKMEADGTLLTPQEYTNNIASYYNTAITVLVFLFVIFSVIGYFHLKFISKEQVKVSLEEGIKDSKKFQEIIMEAISGKADDKYATIESLEMLKEQIIESLEMLKEQMDEEIKGKGSREKTGKIKI